MVLAVRDVLVAQFDGRLEGRLNMCDLSQNAGMMVEAQPQRLRACRPWWLTCSLGGTFFSISLLIYRPAKCADCAIGGEMNLDVVLYAAAPIKIGFNPNQEFR